MLVILKAQVLPFPQHQEAINLDEKYVSIMAKYFQREAFVVSDLACFFFQFREKHERAQGTAPIFVAYLAEHYGRLDKCVLSTPTK